MIRESRVPSGGGDPLLEYHVSELRIASDPLDRRHSLPPPARSGERILDIGCGAGQTLFTAFPDNDSVGLDIDLKAVRFGNSLGLNNRVRFVCGRAEYLPFLDGSFDVVVSRVSLGYTDLPKSLAEIRRVLKAGGRVWMTLLPLSFYWKQALRTNYKGWIYFGFVVLNTLIFHISGSQLRIHGRCDTFQTALGISRALKRYGFKNISAERRASAFIATAEADA